MTQAREGPAAAPDRAPRWTTEPEEEAPETTTGALAPRAAALSAACASAAPPGRNASFTSPPRSRAISFIGLIQSSRVDADTLCVTDARLLRSSLPVFVREGFAGGGAPPRHPGGGRRGTSALMNESARAR